MTHIVLTKRSGGYKLFNKRSGKFMGKTFKDYHVGMKEREKVDKREDRLHPKKINNSDNIYADVSNYPE